LKVIFSYVKTPGYSTAAVIFFKASNSVGEQTNRQSA